MFVVCIFFSNKEPAIVGLFKGLDEASCFEDELIEKYKSKNSEIQYNQTNYGCYEADFDTERHPNVPFLIKIRDIIHPTELHI